MLKIRKLFRNALVLVLLTGIAIPAIAAKKDTKKATDQEPASIVEKDIASLEKFDSGSLESDFGKGLWQTTDDKASGGNSKANLSFTEGFKTKKALRMDYELGAAFQYSYVQLKEAFTASSNGIDISAYNSVSFWIKGNGSKVRVQIATKDVSDYDYHNYVIASVPSEWKQYRIPFTSCLQEGWGTKKELNLSSIVAIQIQTASATAGEKGWIALDNVVLSKSSDLIDPIKEVKLPDVVSLDAFDKNSFKINTVAGASWASGDDQANGGDTKSKFSLGEEMAKGKKTVKLEYELGATYKYRYALAKLDFGTPTDFSKYKTLSFSIRGSGNKVKVMIGTMGVTDYDYHNEIITATTSDWKEYKISLDSIKQEGWGKFVVFDPERINLIQFQTGSGSSGERGWFEIRNLAFGK
jgi:hypothetical protein